MAEIIKKHSRKSKLVPRECIEIEDSATPNSDLEEAVLSIPSLEPSSSLLPKIKDTLNRDSFKETSSGNLSVEVQIEVESFSDEEPVENIIVYNDDEQQFMQSLSKLPKEETVISSEEILEEVDNVAKKITSVADKQLDIYIRNCLGRFVKMHEWDYYEKSIQEILAQWRVWVCLSKIRSFVLAYKCNVCCLGWWHLGPFEEHIRIHKNLTLKLETFHHDCVITATSGKWFENVCQPKIEGNCPKCLKGYEHHKQQKYTNSLFYLCEACGDSFSTCKALFVHEGKCAKYERLTYQHTRIHGENRCSICETNCLTKERYEEHLQEYHDVRSDEPMVSTNVPKECGACGMKYFVHNLHKCPKRQDNFKCSFCCRKFPNKFLLCTHETSYNSSCYCPVCNKYMKKQCMLYEHLLRHSKYYTMAFKCQDCSDHVLLTSVHLMSLHKQNYHKIKKTIGKCDWSKYETLFLPVKCLITHTADPASVMDMVLEKRTKNPKPTNKEMLEALTDIIQSREAYEEMTKQREQAENETKDVENVSRELANETEISYDNEVQNAVDSLKFEPDDTIPNDNSTVNDNFDDDNNLGIDDDDINETESSVNALLLNQFNIKHEIDIEEPDLPPYLFLQKSAQRISRDSNDSKESSGILVKKELLCEEVLPMDVLDDFSLKRETPEPQLMIVEDSQENICDEVGIGTENVKSVKETISKVPEELNVDQDSMKIRAPEPQLTVIDDSDKSIKKEMSIVPDNLNDDKDCVEIPAPEPQLIVIDDSDDESYETATEVPERQTIVSKQNEKILETHVIIKQESVDENEFKNLIPEESEGNVAKDNEIKTKDVTESVEKNVPLNVEVNIKEENVDQGSDVEMESEILKEQEACLEELSKVFQASKCSKEVKLSNICVNEIKVKNEAMDTDEIFEDDIIILNSEQKFFNVTSEALTSSFSDKSSDELNNLEINLSHLEPNISLKTEKESKEKREKKTNNKIYKCKRCKFVGDHKRYKIHKTILCPFTRKRSPNKRKISNQVWRDLNCTSCGVIFQTLTTYYYHLCEVHNLSFLSCPQCHDTLKTPAPVLGHLTSHIRRTFIKVQVIKKHVQLSSLSSGVYRCRVCTAEVAYRDFFNHWEAHLDLNFKQNHTERNFDDDHEEKKLVIDEGVLKVTVKQEDVPPKSPEYTLSQSDIKRLTDQLTTPKSKLKRKSRELWKCCVCGRGFVRHNDIKRHVIEHLLKAAYGRSAPGLQCQLCGDTFDKPDSYKTHMRQHGAMPLFTCERCNKCFSDSSNFSKHKKVHNLQALICDNCGRKFHSKKQLEKHMELHRNTQPMQCNICSHVFSLPSYYKKHMRSHNIKGGSGYCKICHKREETKREMWDHMWKAHNIRLHQADCLVCDKSFRKYLDVRQHMRRVHKLNQNVTIKTLKALQELTVEQRAEKIRKLVSPPVSNKLHFKLQGSKPSTGETYVM